MEILRYIFLGVAGQDLRITDDLAAERCGLDLLPQSISLRLEGTISALGVATSVRDRLTGASTTGATTASTDSGTEAVHNAVDVRVGLERTGTGVVACVECIGVLRQGLGGVSGKVDAAIQTKKKKNQRR